MKDFFEIVAGLVIVTVLAIGAFLFYFVAICFGIFMYLMAALIGTAKYWIPPLILVVALKVLGIV